MKAIIEIPKGDDRRRHLKHDKSGFIENSDAAKQYVEDGCKKFMDNKK